MRTEGERGKKKPWGNSYFKGWAEEEPPEETEEVASKLLKLGGL